MKKLKIIISLLVLIFLSIYLFIIYLNNNGKNDSIVFIESFNDEILNEGMGFVYEVDNDGAYILTNYHVIHNGKYLYVYNLNNKKERANIVAYDKYTDIAILQIKNKLKLKEANIANVDVKVNDNIYFYNIYNSKIEKGLVLELNKNINISTNYGTSFYNAISIKGNFQEGNSGGPIFNKKNEVIGVLALKQNNSDIGFYMPISYVTEIVTKLKNQELVRPNLGATFSSYDNTEILIEYGIETKGINGVVVLDVIKDYPLNRVGIIKGDIITKVNEVIIETVSELQEKIYSYDVGDTIILEYYRNNQYNLVEVILDK